MPQKGIGHFFLFWSPFGHFFGRFWSLFCLFPFASPLLQQDASLGVQPKSRDSRAPELPGYLLSFLSSCTVGTPKGATAKGRGIFESTPSFFGQQFCPKTCCVDNAQSPQHTNERANRALVIMLKSRQFLPLWNVFKHSVF